MAQEGRGRCPEVGRHALPDRPPAARAPEARRGAGAFRARAAARSRQVRGRVCHRTVTRRREPFPRGHPSPRDRAEIGCPAQHGGIRPGARAGRRRRSGGSAADAAGDPARQPRRFTELGRARSARPAAAVAFAGCRLLQRSDPRGAALVEAAPGHGARARHDGALPGSHRPVRAGGRAGPSRSGGAAEPRGGARRDRTESRRAHPCGGGGAPQAELRTGDSVPARPEMIRRISLPIAAAPLFAACSRGHEPPATPAAARPSILLITIDTTRADAIGPEAAGVETPAFNAIAARGRRFRQAYATVPETLPSHSSMMTGLYPGGHGVHENARYLGAGVPVAAERLRQAGYRTSAFVSSFVLARRFGLARGFEVYDDTVGSANERAAAATTDAALGELLRPSSQPRFMWVHYYDPHTPYAPPEPYRTRYAANPYLGEVAAVDEQIGRLVQAFEDRAAGGAAIVIAADHGEGLGEHGEAQHGDLLYRSTMHVPLVIAGPGVTAGIVDTPVTTRRIFHTLLDWAGLDAAHSLRSTAADEVVLGEAMKPFLEYGWQPQVMAAAGRYKAILAGTIETYDIVADPQERHDLGNGVELPAGMRKALEDYPVPSPDVARAPANLDEDAKRRRASLGYVGATAAPVVG